MIRPILAATALMLVPAIAMAPTAQAEPPIYTGTFSNTALQGHDPVAYFTEGKPVKGSKDYTTEYMGAEFRFATAANRDTFIADPAAYAPQYGGYCAWAIADGKHAKGDADHWAIVDGKLYLNYNKSIQEKWNADRSGFIERADVTWPEINN